MNKARLKRKSSNDRLVILRQRYLLNHSDVVMDKMIANCQSEKVIESLRLAKAIMHLGHRTVKRAKALSRVNNENED